MNRKLLVPLLLLILLPVLALAGAAWRLLGDRQQLWHSEHQQLVDGQLMAVDQQLAGLLEEQQQQLQLPLQWLNQPTLPVTELRQWLRQRPQVEHLIILSSGGDRLYPTTPLRSTEQQFFAETAALWLDSKLLYATATEQQPVMPTRAIWNTQSSNSVSIGSKRSEAIEQGADALQSGWYSWTGSGQLQVFRWQRDPAGRLWVLHWQPQRLLADIIATLPDASASVAALRLSNSQGELLYQWGEHQPAAEQSASARLMLSAPLSAWQLEYFAAPSSPGMQQWWRWQWLLWLVLAVITILLLGSWLAWAQRRELLEAEQRVSFVNQVSHELKTPLTNIRMYAELMQPHIDPAAQPLPKYLQVVVSESERLSRLINNVLQFARAGRGQLKISPRPVLANEFLQELVSRFQPLLAERGMLLSYVHRAENGEQAAAICNAEAEQVNIDPDALEQVLTNLFSNAEKYAASGGRLELLSVLSPAEWQIWVQDFGPGVVQSEQQRIFEPFYRLSDAHQDAVAGTGIGLDLARQLCRLHGGELSYCTDAAAKPSSGACFLITLPLRHESLK